MQYQQQLNDCVAAGMDESWGRCTVNTIPDILVENLKKLGVEVIGEERPLAISQIQYEDEPWKILRKWATSTVGCDFQHSVVLAHYPKSKNFSVTNVLGSGRPNPVLPQFSMELRSLCRECSEISRKEFESKQIEGYQPFVYEECGEYFYHGKYSWDTLVTRLQSPGPQYPLLSRLPPRAYICDIMYNYADCAIFVSVFKTSE